MAAKKKAVISKSKSPTASSASAKKNPKGELVTEQLPFELTEAEIAKKGEIAGEQSETLGQMKAEFKAIRSDWKGKIDTLQAELNTNLSCIHRGMEDREVECVKVFNKESDMISFWFNGEMMKDRPANDLDRQKAMPFLRKKKENGEDTKFNGMVIDHKLAASNDDSFEDSIAQ